MEAVVYSISKTSLDMIRIKIIYHWDWMHSKQKNKDLTHNHGSNEIQLDSNTRKQAHDIRIRIQNEE